jgi:hypothetical protein
VEGAEAYLKDLPDAQLYFLETGHFALEEELDFIADKMNEFLAYWKKRLHRLGRRSPPGT